MASVAAYPETLRAHLPIADTDVVLFGLALGHADPEAAANRTRTVREPIEANVVFCS
jgi:ectoine hydroxylase-related dioxygenase (phytanoyl-CoA dioxygenase family)